MFSKYSVYCLLFATCCFFTSCKKDNDSYSDPEPKITLLSVTSLDIKEGDALTFRIQYIDGDGDLGENNPNVKNLFLTDNRVNVTYEYRIQELAPVGNSIAIRGTLDVVLNSTAITNSDTTQQVSYSIYMKDRAGHQSNIEVSPEITIHE